MNHPMMQPGQWANGVPEPNYAQPLLNFQQRQAQPQQQPGQPQAQPQAPRQPMPMQIAPGPGQAQPMRPPQQAGGMAPGMNAMAATADATPWASALMRMFGGQGFQGGAVSPGNLGGTGGPMGAGSGQAIY